MMNKSNGLMLIYISTHISYTKKLSGNFFHKIIPANVFLLSEPCNLESLEPSQNIPLCLLKEKEQDESNPHTWIAAMMLIPNTEFLDMQWENLKSISVVLYAKIASVLGGQAHLRTKLLWTHTLLYFSAFSCTVKCYTGALGVPPGFTHLKYPWETHQYYTNHFSHLFSIIHYIGIPSYSQKDGVLQAY